MQIKVIAMDADHTLYELDTKIAYKRFFLYLSEKLNVKREILEKTFLETLEEVKKSKKPKERRREYCLKKTIDKLGVKYSDEVVPNSLRIFWDEVLNSLVPKRGVIEFVQKYKEKYTIGVFTEEFRKVIEEKLEKVFGNWKKSFKFLITSEDTEEMKPSEKYYEKILEITKVRAEDVVVIGDSWKKDLKIAKEKRMITVLVSNEKEGSPNIFVKDFKELDEKKVFTCFS